MPSSNNQDKEQKSIQGFDISQVQVTDLASIQKKKLATNLSQLQTSAGQTIGGQNIVTIDMPKDQAVSSFSPGKLHDERGVRYSDVQSGIADHSIRKNARFRVSELTRGPLSVDEEEEARIEAEIQARLEKRFEEVREQTTKDAYEAGFQAGKNDGKAEVLNQAKPFLQGFESLIAQFEGMKAEVFKANEDFLIRMAYRLAKAVILREIKEDTDYTKRLATQLIERVGTRENIKIYVGEKEYSSAEALKTGLAQTLGELKNISIELDPNVTDQGCRVETEFGEVDARIEVQIQSIAQTLGATSA